MNRESTLSLTIMVIIMALLAIFIGYLLGNWLIQFVTGDPTSNQQILQQTIEQEEIIGDEKIPDSDSPSFADSLEETSSSWDLTAEDSKVYVVQVGAFNDYMNAVSFKNELREKGFQPVITDDTLPYKVQLGASNNRLEAEKIEEKIKEMGYDAFITH